MIPVVCVAGGPSYSAAQTALVNQAHTEGKCHLLVCNVSWEKHPQADVLYAADDRWWKSARHGQRALREFQGEMWTCKRDMAHRFGLCHVKLNDRAKGLIRDPKDGIASGGNSGYQLIGLAYKFLREHGESGPIVLVGYDMKKGPHGENHHHADYAEEMIEGRKVRFTNSGSVASWAPRFVQLAEDLQDEGVRVVNCSLDTALCFERGDLDMLR